MLALEQAAEQWPFSAEGGVVRPLWPPPLATGLDLRHLRSVVWMYCDASSNWLTVFL